MVGRHWSAICFSFQAFQFLNVLLLSICRHEKQQFRYKRGKFFGESRFHLLGDQ